MQAARDGALALYSLEATGSYALTMPAHEACAWATVKAHLTVSHH